jgi:dTDP-4-dehydrorhamnose reductase
MRRILVIGAKGMLGKDLVEILRSSSRVDQHLDWEVFGWDIEEIDIQEEKNTVTKIESLRPNIVINIAAYTNVDGCESHDEKAFAINAEGMRHVALGALRCRAKVVYLSTDYIFDGKKREPYLEDDPPHPLSVYGRSKLRGEQYVQEMVEDALIVRTQWLYGKYGNNFVASVLRQAREKKVLSIVNDQVGSPTYTIDLSRAISVLIQCDARGVFHVANSDLCTWFVFGQEILKLSGMEEVRIVPISSEELGRPATRPLYSVLNTEKLKRETGMTLRPWSEALRDYLRDWESERTNPLLQK